MFYTQASPSDVILLTKYDGVFHSLYAEISTSDLNSQRTFRYFPKTDCWDCLPRNPPIQHQVFEYPIPVRFECRSNVKNSIKAKYIKRKMTNLDEVLGAYEDMV